jgi:hypothetical protein
VIRTLIGVERPSFIAERIIPPASNANSRLFRVNGGVSGVNPVRASAARNLVKNSRELRVSHEPGRSRATHSWADCFRSGMSWTFNDRIHRPGVRGERGRPVRRQPDLADHDFQVVPSFFLTNVSTAST